MTLQQQLQATHEALSKLRSVDTETRQQLLVLLADISQLLHPDAPADTDDTPTERLESIAARFDADHPALSAAVRQLVDALGKAGI